MKICKKNGTTLVQSEDDSAKISAESRSEFGKMRTTCKIDFAKYGCGGKMTQQKSDHRAMDLAALGLSPGSLVIA